MEPVLNENEKALIVAPHPDDETVGCGGFIALHRGKCDVLLVTDRGKGDSLVTGVREIRQKEFAAAADYLGFCKRYMLHIPEGRIGERRNDFFVIDWADYKYVFVPARWEDHSDHVDVYNAVKRAVDKRARGVELIEYEVWSTIPKPNVKVDISSVIDKKREAIEMYASQTKDLDYVGMTIGLNAYRGKSRGCDYAEAFFSATEDRRKKKKARRKKIKALLGR